MIRLAWLVSFFSGFISLSEEVVWVRIVSFMTQGSPNAFAIVLIMYLGGIALGAFSGKRMCERGQATPTRVGWILLVAALLLIAMPFSLSFFPDNLAAKLSWALILILISATVKGTLFPIVHHLGSSTETAVGRSVSLVYFCNILGATTGPLVAGLIILDYVSSGATLQILGILAAFIGLIALAYAHAHTQSSQLSGIALLSLTIVVGIPLCYWQGDTLMKSLAFGKTDTSTLTYFQENRHGIIHAMTSDRENIDIIYGGNVYDGRTNIDLLDNSNMIDRAYLAYALHPEPKNVLVIGLSSGAWVHLLTAVPSIENIDVVEINPGYLDMIRTYDVLSPLLDDPRVHIHIDDGRRWLRRHQEQKFDLVIMNTTFHWRANATNLLSKEMMMLVQSALAPGGIVAFNATGSIDAFLTAAETFPHTYRFRSFIYASEHDFRDELQNVPSRVRRFSIDAQALVGDDEQSLDALERLRDVSFSSIETDSEEYGRAPQIVTDQNMITEFRFGRGK